MELARQLRSAFFGAEALRQQRGRDEVRTYVRLPRNERDSEYNVEQLLLRTPSGSEIPLGQAAESVRGRSYTQIERVDGRRVVSVTAELRAGVSVDRIMTDVMGKFLPRLSADIPGLEYAPGGEQKDRQITVAAMQQGFALAMICVFGILGVVFRSYVQPMIIMVAIPFGLIGAICGHLLMGYDISIVSMMGLVALSGIVVNDSLVLIDAVNRLYREGMPIIDAVVAGGVRRIRPILLTSLTTFFGLVPMIVEPSMQARFLIPMAISIAFGVMFATVITLLLVPALYVALEDVRRALSRFAGSEAPPLESVETTTRGG
ncbi:MAG: efflux RND transporter permease subunit [Myxococcota bacterium]